MAERDEIIAWVDELLDSPGFPDYGPNGLQVPGSTEVSRVISCVSATLEVFEAAAARGAELVIAHHGIFWGESGALSGQQAARLRALLLNDINLAAWHLPLDAHSEVGNNALLIDALELSGREPFGDYKGRTIGFVASTEAPLSGESLALRIKETLGRDPLHLAYGPEEISRVAVVTGSAPDYIDAAFAAGAQAFVTGEPAERVNANAKELGLHFYAAGHHATETLGIRRIGELIADRFRVVHEFVDIPNPI